MSTTPKSLPDDHLNDSWVELGCGSEDGSHARNTPVSLVGSILNSNMEKLLWEAQRESNHSSATGSAISSHRDSPKSPHSPANEPANLDSFVLEKALEKSSEGSVDLDHFAMEKDDLLEDAKPRASTDWIWDWSSRPDRQPPKGWNFKHPQRVGLSLRNSKAAKRGLFSTEVLSILVLTNLLSIVLGAGIGLFIGKRLGTGMSTIALD